MFPLSRKRMATTARGRRKMPLLATVWTGFFGALLITMLVALWYVYSQFPVAPTRINKPQHSSSRSSKFKQQQQQYKKTTTLEKIQARHHKQHAKHSPALASASADGGETPDVALLPQIIAKNPPRVFTCRCYPQVKYAFARRGFSMKQQQDDYQDSWIIWKTGTDIDVNRLQSWQRPNHFPGERLMDSKGAMYQVLRMYSVKHKVPLDFLPETFLLYTESDKSRFVQRLNDGGGMDMPWVLKRTKASRGRGVSMLGPQSTELKELRNDLANGPIKKGHIVQTYIKNEWTFQGHKCDLRVYVLVASVDPLIVYYHDGIVRTAIGLYNEDNFDESKAHLTNVSQNKMNRTLWEPVKTFGQLEEELEVYVKRDDVFVETNDPALHVRNQIKEILGVVFAAFKDRISLEKTPVDNAFALMGADFVIDQDLKVWLLEMQLGPQLLGDNHKEKIDILQDVLTTTIDVVEEVFHKQNRKEPLLPLTKTGNFELVYFDQSYQFQPLDE